MSESPQPVDPFLLRQLRQETAAKAAGVSAPTSNATGAPDDLRAAVAAAAASLDETLVALSHDLAEHPEVAFEEHRSAAALADLVASHGIAVTRSAYGLETALRAEVGDPDGPTIAILSEYDALPGIGHGCGHNIIATTGVGAFLALAGLGEQLPGRVVWMGTPAEEGGSGKELMALEGAFDDVDAAIMVHPFTADLSDSVFLGRRQLRATFTGITSHASAQPFMGRNALDAVNLTYTGVGLHRQQMPPTDRLHCVITDGGQRPNVIPERAEILYYVRSQYPETLRILSDRLADIARGAALMTGCTVKLAWDEAPPYLPLRTNQPLAQSWNRRYGEHGHPVLSPDVVPSMFAGSTDFGNVSYRVPGLHAMVKICDEDISLHTREMAAAGVSPAGDQVLRDAALTMAEVALDWLCDDELRRHVAEDFAAAGGVLDVPSYFD